MNENTKISREVLALVKKHGPITSPDLAKKMGKTVATVDFYMRILHAAKPKLVYVAKKRDTEGRGRNARLWAAGDLDDEIEIAPVRALPEPDVAAESEDEFIASDVRRREAITANRVFRDPMLFFTAGRAP